MTLARIEEAIDSLCTAADEAGVGMSAWLDTTPDTSLWLNGLDRIDAPKGAGSTWLTALLTLAKTHQLPVRLTCWAMNSALISYYERHGFLTETIEDEDAILIAHP